MEKSEITTLRGIVIPSAWNAAGEVICVSVATYQEEKIDVADTPTGRKLLTMLQKRVIVQGCILRGDEGITIDIINIFPDESPIQDKAI